MEISVMMQLVEWEESVRDSDLELNFQNDGKSKQHNTSHVPNQAIPMNTFPQYPKEEILPSE